MTKFTKEQLIARIEKQIDINATIIERLGDDSAAVSELAVEFATMDIQILDIALAALMAEPFMHGIVDPDGIAHMDENCVALKPYALDEEVDALNDECPEPPFKVVPLYRQPLLEGLK